MAGILENSDPSIYEQKEQRPRPKLGPFLGVISQILEDDKTDSYRSRVRISRAAGLRSGTGDARIERRRARTELATSHVTWSSAATF